MTNITSIILFPLLLRDQKYHFYLKKKPLIYKIYKTNFISAKVNPFIYLKHKLDVKKKKKNKNEKCWMKKCTIMMYVKKFQFPKKKGKIKDFKKHPKKYFLGKIGFNFCFLNNNSNIFRSSLLKINMLLILCIYFVYILKLYGHFKYFYFKL